MGERDWAFEICEFVRSVKIGERDEGRETCELPQQLQEEILAFMPLKSLGRCRLVCQEWNALLSSTKFITNKWKEKAPNKKPWLILQNGKYEMANCWAYCFFTGAWKKTPFISFSFIYGGVERDYVGFCNRSAAGLFLVDIGHAFSSPNYFIVCNPLTRTSVKLPPLSSITTVILRGIVGDSRDTYKVVAVGDLCHRGPDIVEIYDSTEKSWRIIGNLPGEVRMIKTEMVFCGDFFYCLAMVIAGEMGTPSILGFSIRDGTSISVPLPETTGDNYMMPHLLVCGSRVLVVGGIALNWEYRLHEVVIWELEKVNVNSSASPSSSWKEITKMPSSMCDDLNRTLPSVNYSFSIMQIVGVGDCACIVNNVMDMMEALVYSLSQNSWSLLPSCPLDKGTSDNMGHMGIMAFEPRPDMKVG